MTRYADSVSALKHALRLMTEEGDTLLVASIAHPLFLAEVRHECEKIDRLDRTRRDR